MSRTIIQGNGHKLCYIHIPCTGGRSVMHALHLLPSHTTAADARRRHPDLTGTFAVVRSPFTLAVSWYNRIHGHDEDVAKFRAWAEAGFPHNLIPLENSGLRADPLDQSAWIDNETTVFAYPRLDAAASWAASLCGISRRSVAQHGTWRKTVPWRDYYNAATAEAVRLRWGGILLRAAFPISEILA